MPQKLPEIIPNYFPYLEFAYLQTETTFSPPPYPKFGMNAIFNNWGLGTFTGKAVSLGSGITYYLCADGTTFQGTYPYQYSDHKHLFILEYQAGRFHGQNLIYSADGRLEKSERWIKGLRHGKTRTFYCKGMVESSCDYKNDLLNGESMAYYSNGQIACRGVYSAGKAEGLHESFTKTGRLRGSGFYLAGEREGFHFWPYANNRIRTSGVWHRGFKDGFHQIFYKNGCLRNLGHWHDGKREGMHKSFFRCGRLQFAGAYQNGSGIGVHRGYSRAGNELWAKNYSTTTLFNSVLIVYSNILPVPLTFAVTQKGPCSATIARNVMCAVASSRFLHIRAPGA